MVGECTENVEKVSLAKITSAEDKNMHKSSSFTLYIVLFLILFTINTGIGRYFHYFHCYLKKVLLVLSLVPVLKQQPNQLIKVTSQGNKH